MRKNLRKLNLLFKYTRLKPEMFYVITVYGHSIDLQGHLNAENIKILRSLFGANTHQIMDTGYLQFYKNNLVITLT